MKVIWILEDIFGYEEDGGSLQRMIDAIKEEGHDAKVISYELTAKKVDMDNFSNDDCIIFRGSLGETRQIQRTRPWVPGTIANFPHFHFAYWGAYWGKYLMNQEYAMMPYGEFLRRKDWVFENFGTEGRIFVRPDDGFKSFSGHVVDEDFINTAKDPLNVVPSKIMFISKVQTITEEYRFVVVKNQVVAVSKYMSNNELDLEEGAPEAAWELAREIAQEEWQPDLAYTLDIAKSDSYDDFRLLEVNSFSAADIYACDPKPVVKAISEVAIEEWRSIYGDED